MATDNALTTQRPIAARHSVSLLHPHLVFVTTYRRPVFTDAMLTFTKNTMLGVRADLNTEVAELNGEAHPVHLLMECPPTLAIAVLVQRLKGRIAYAVRRHYTASVSAPARGHLWSSS